MAVVILGGLVTSTLLSLFVVPALYLQLRRLEPRPAMTPADELMHRWAGVEPAARLTASRRCDSGHSRRVMSRAGAHERPTHGGADSGIQPRGEE